MTRNQCPPINFVIGVVAILSLFGWGLYSQHFPDWSGQVARYRRLEEKELLWAAMGRDVSDIERQKSEIEANLSRHGAWHALSEIR